MDIEINANQIEALHYLTSDDHFIFSIKTERFERRNLIVKDSESNEEFIIDRNGTVFSGSNIIFQL